MGRRKDEPILQYVQAHPRAWERSADVVARAIGMDEHELRCLVHESQRLKMRAILLGWHVVELAEAPEKANETGQEKVLDTG